MINVQIRAQRDANQLRRVVRQRNMTLHVSKKRQVLIQTQMIVYRVIVHCLMEMIVQIVSGCRNKPLSISIKTTTARKLAVADINDVINYINILRKNANLINKFKIIRALL